MYKISYNNLKQFAYAYLIKKTSRLTSQSEILLKALLTCP